MADRDHILADSPSSRSPTDAFHVALERNSTWQPAAALLSAVCRAARRSKPPGPPFEAAQAPHASFTSSERVKCARELATLLGEVKERVVNRAPVPPQPRLQNTDAPGFPAVVHRNKSKVQAFRDRIAVWNILSGQGSALYAESPKSSAIRLRMAILLRFGILCGNPSRDDDPHAVCSNASERLLRRLAA